jgi:serine/threonine protein kinase
MADHTILKRPFTLKMSTQGSGASKKSYNYIIKEGTDAFHSAQVLKKLVHPCIYRCHKLLKSKSNFYMVLDYLEGETLESRMKGKFSFESSILSVI